MRSALALLALWSETSRADAATLSIQELPSGVVQIVWPVETANVSLEQADSLATPVSWRAVDEPISSSGGQFSVLVQAGAATRFYRLRSGNAAAPASIVETSPASGESGIAVTRETIFRLSAPLAADTLVPPENLYAAFGARRLLTRIELSGDRKAVTLFYLENLPGSARIRVTFNGTGIRATGGIDIDADQDGLPGGVRVLEFETAGITGLMNTAVIGRVYASEKGPGGENQPLENVIVTVDGAEETLRTTTDATGFFKLEPAPAGRFFVHVDGRTAVGSSWPGGAYYPFVGKAWETVAGRTNNLAGGSGDIFLPLISEEALRPVSATQETRITFASSVLATNPALAGVEVAVPPDSLFSENGSRGGSVGIAAVPPDRLPEPLPPGLDLPLVITIQTDGPMNFDRPVPVRFPNLPDPSTGVKLPPGAKTALWSFNHDTGQWEIQGSATVTSDGDFAESDPGVGVRQPGWHGVGPGSSGGSGPWPNGHDDDGDDNDDDEEDDDDGDDVDPCKKKRHLAESAAGQCGGDVGGTLGELLFKKTFESIPLLGCGLSIAQGIGGAVVDCNIDFDTCDNTVIGQTAGTLVGCIPVVGGVGSFLYDCLYQVSQADKAYEDCLKGIRRSGPQTLSTPASIPEDIFIEQAELWAAAAAVYALVLGDVKWTLIHPSGWPSAYAVFETLQQSIQPSGPGGDRIVPSERAAILALPRPVEITDADVSAVVDRFDQIMAGPPPANLNLAAIGAAAAKFEATMLELQNRGWKTTYDGFIYAFTKWSQDQSGIIDGASVGSASARLTPDAAPSAGPQTSQRRRVKRVAAPLYYKLTDMVLKFVRHGRLSNQGTLANLIVRPNTLYSIEYFDPASMQKGRSFFISGRNGSSFRLPNYILLSTEPPDTDQDGLPDDAERIVGTDPAKVDTDADGAGDGEELRSGSNPLDGIAQTLGPIASVEIGGEAFDLAAQREIAAVIGRRTGLTLLNVSNPEQPIVISSRSEEADPTALAMEWPHILTADSGRGLTLLNVQNPADPAVLWRTSASAAATSLALGFGNAYVAEGRLRVYELGSGKMVQELAANGYQSVGISGERLYAMRSAAGQSFFLDVFRLEENWTRPILEGSVELTGRNAPLETHPPMLVGDGYAHLGFFQGYQVVDLLDPKAPVIVGRSERVQAAIHGLHADGSGLLAAVTSFARPDTLQISLYDASQPTVTTNFLAGFDTPGNARRVALYRGRMLIADESAGLTIANYRNAEVGTNPPSVNLVAFTTFREPPVHPAGEPLRLEPSVRDDVAVREVEFYLDGALANSSGSYPFATEVQAPRHSPQRQSFSVRARAIDLGGNAAWSAPLTIGLTNELRRPFLISFTPPAGSLHLNGSTLPVSAAFNEPMSLASLGAAWTLHGFGTDGQPGTADDLPLPTTVHQTGPTNYLLQFTQPLDEGLYFAQLTTNATDLSGNGLSTPVTWAFGLRPWITYIGTNDLWTQAPNSRTNWSGGALPRTNDFVEINLPDGRVLRARQNTAAYQLVARTPVAFEGIVDQGFSSAFLLVSHATFEKAVTMHGQASWTGGSSDILESLDLTGTHNKFLNSHILVNHGRMTMHKSLTEFNGLLLNAGAVIRNLPQATWEHFGGNVVGGRFENLGRFIKHETNTVRLDMPTIINLGSIEVRGGTLQLTGGSLFGEWHQHLGSYRVDAGARLLLDTEFCQYGPSTRVSGDGDVEFAAARPDTVFPGTLEVAGSVTLVPGPRKSLHLSGPVNTTGPWRIGAGNVRLTGLSAQIKGPVTVEGNGSLTVSTPAPLVLSSLAVSGELTVDTALQVDGPLALDGAILSGFGRLRANGPVTVKGNIGGSRGTTQVFGSFELAGAATCDTLASVNVTAYDLRILSTGALDIGPASYLRFGPRQIVNDGALLKTNAGVTRVLNSLHNRGLFRVAEGSLDFEQAGLLQTAGLTTLNTTGIVFRLLPGGSRGEPSVTLQGGRFEGNAVVVCVSVTNSAVMAPGLPIGTLDFHVGTRPADSLYRQTASGALLIDIAGPEPGIGHDQLIVSGRALLDGALEISLAAGYDPPVGQEFTIVRSSQVEGQFAIVRGAAIAGGKHLDAVYEDQAVKLRVAAGPTGQ